MATATPVSISTISRTSNVVTVVTGSAHGLLAGQGFAIAGVTDASFNGNNTVSTVTNSTTYTFKQTAANASSSGGTSVAAKQVIIMSIFVSQGGRMTIRYLLWLTTTQPIPLPSVQSSWVDASTAEVNAIQAGTTIEINDSMSLPSTLTKAQVQTVLANEFTARQAYLAGNVQPGQFFGVFEDSVGWSS